MMRIAVLIKQVPRAESMELGPDGRLVRHGLELEMNAYCRRAIGKGIELARETGGHCTVLTLGPAAAEDILREAVAGGADEGLLISDPAFAGSDTLATARALAAALSRAGPFDLVLVGRNSVDADTGQVGPAVAELLELPFVGGARELQLEGDRLAARCEREDGWIRASVRLPAVVSAAERLCRPLKAPPDDRRAVPPERVRRIGARDLGPGPWGQAGSPTRVGRIRTLETGRSGLRLGGSLEDQVRQACRLLRDRGAPASPSIGRGPAVPPRRRAEGPAIAVIAEPGRSRLTRELAGAAAGLARRLGGHAVAFSSETRGAEQMGPWGIDVVVAFEGVAAGEGFARVCADWAAANRPWSILAPSTMWGREIAARVAARLGAGLTGDAVGLEVESGRLVAWKPAFGGRLVAAITAESAVQMVTVRPGTMPAPEPRAGGAVIRMVSASGRDRVEVLERVQEDDPDRLVSASTVIGVGTGVPFDEYERLQPLLETLGAELAATRKVTDLGWLPRSRQVGLTGLSIAPRLYLAVGLSGKFNHAVGIRNAGTVLAINADPNAPIFNEADIGIIGDWRDVVPILVEEAARRRSTGAKKHVL